MNTTTQNDGKLTQNGKVTLSDGRVIVMRRPKVKDVNNVRHIEDSLEREQMLIVNLTEMTKEDLDDLYIQDYELLQKLFVDLRSASTKVKL